MGKKRRHNPTLEELLDRMWCYYCEREFEDLKLLMSHQKAKHFKCERCGRRLNTAGGLSVHMNQVHKETLTHVENAIEGREFLDVEIFGMEGVPEEALQRHNQKVIEAFHKTRADRQAATGNPPPGLPGSQRPAKKIKYETAEELKKRLAEWRAQAGAREAAAKAAAAASAAANNAANATTATSTSAPGEGLHSATAGDHQASPFAAPGSVLPTRPSGGLPQRPSGYARSSAAAAAAGGASTLDDLVSGASHAHGDDIDKIIRMAEAGIKPVEKDKDKEKPEKSKKDKAMRMVYADGDFSLEERMAEMPQYKALLA